MTVPLRNTVYDKISEAGALTDVELYKAMIKGGVMIAEDRFNKVLLDLEIMGLIKVSWVTKDERRIEKHVIKEEIDDIEAQNKKTLEKDYEASFPGFEK